MTTKRFKPGFLVAFGLIPLGLAGMIVFVILSSREEPLVIDNGPLQVRRTIREGKPAREQIPAGDPQRWHLHHSLPLRDLHVRVVRMDGSGKTYGPVSMSGIGKEGVTFELITPDAINVATTTVTLYRDPLLTDLPWRQALHLSSHHPFELVEDGSDVYLRPVSGDALRIRQIRVGNREVICARSADAPASGACTGGDVPNREVKVAICTRSDIACPSF